MLLTGGFFLPSLVARVEDQQIIGKLDITGTQSISFESKSELSIIDRLQVRSNSSSIALDKGKNMEVAEAAFQCAITELEKFNQYNVMDIDLSTCVMTENDAEFLIDATDPSKNVIVWNIMMKDNNGHSIFVSVDDETGIMTYLYYFVNVKQARYDLTEVPKPAEKAADMDMLRTSIAAYYGLDSEIVSTKPDPYDAYTLMILKLNDGEGNVEMAVEAGSYGFYIYVIN
jgi:hypothetical protein